MARLIEKASETAGCGATAVKPGRDEQRARQRYLRMSKEVLVDRLIAVERLHAQERGRWLTQQDEVLTWRLRAETAEARLKESTRTQ